MLTSIESLKELLTNSATGKMGEGSAKKYVELRQGLISASSYRSEIPKWLIECRDIGDFWSFIKSKFSTYAERRTFIQKQLGPLFKIAETNHPSLLEEQMIKNPQLINIENIQELCRKTIERKNADPDGAITIARTLLETVCRKVLIDLQVSIKENPELPQLYRAVSKELNLAPDLHSEQLFKQILGSCTQIVEGIGAIRNNHGDSHATKPGKFRPVARHAALAINLTFSITTFLLDTTQSVILKKN